MQAVLMTAAGGVECLEVADIAEPKIQHPGQIKVAIRAAGVNPIDTKLRNRGVFFDDALPAVLGCDGAGEVIATGAAVHRFRVGDRVWFCHGGLGADQGNYARFKVLDQSQAEHMPGSLDFHQAAALPLVLLTAWEALFDRARVDAGQQVVIHAGAGGVGHIAIQLARHRGARVASTVSPDKIEFVRELGAELAIDYRSRDFVEPLLEWTEGRGVDMALDTVGAPVMQRTVAAMAYGGDLVTLLDPGAGFDWKEARNRNLRISLELMLTPMLQPHSAARARQGEILRQAAALIDQGKIKVEIARIMPLEQAAVAHQLIEQGHTRGKLVLAVA